MAAKLSVDRINEDLLTCPVCFERYKQPKLLPCQHSFCEQCLVEWTDKHGRLECPNCRQCHNTVSNIQQLPPSMVINAVISIVEEQERKQSHGTCHGCQENPTTHRCIDCALDLCTTCTKVHNKMPVSQHHRSVSVVEFQQAKSITLPTLHCTAHGEKPFELYCESCQVAICMLCLRSEHKGHEVVDLHGAADQFSKVTTNHLKLLKAKHREIQQSRTSAAKLSKELENQLKLREQHVKKHTQETIEKLIKILKQEERSHLRKINLEYNGIKEAINREIQQYNINEELLLSTVAFVDNLLQYSSSAQLMNTSKETMNRLEILMSLNTTLEEKVADNSLPLFYPSNIILQGSLGTLTVKSTVCRPAGSSGLNQDCIITEQPCEEVMCKNDDAFPKDQKPNDVAKVQDQHIVERPIYCNSHTTATQTGTCGVHPPMTLTKLLGGPGNEPGMFDYPFGVQVTTQNKIVVADYRNNRVQIINQFGKPEFSFPVKSQSYLSFGSLRRAEQKISPMDVAVSLDDRYFFTHGIGEKRVIVCNKFGREIQGLQNKVLNHPCGIAINHNTGIVHVVDRGSKCIRLYDVQGCDYITSIGQFEDPRFIAINNKGNLIVSDFDCIHTLTPEGAPMFTFRGCPDDQFQYPFGVATDKNDNIYVCDTSGHRVQMFSSEGDFIRNVSSGRDALSFPIGVATTTHDEVVVTDSTNFVKVFSPNTEWCKKYKLCNTGRRA
ncbi:E3 ubiquitin-protein ligase TRIM71-like [Saccoglossus kowalevskii]|uniref:E3 ubiquitin-protein ligase TRIM71-like n=1 Tax=Saccoglossus kowalevskii TaxID=10224 RepID=A0ABM0GQN2_SACKO|nr:PREDICTED: E3 ubiquitin-protein ligase TRIM71-like [Saccoglossus kowalevskii]